MSPVDIDPPSGPDAITDSLAAESVESPQPATPAHAADPVAPAETVSQAPSIATAEINATPAAPPVDEHLVRLARDLQRGAISPEAAADLLVEQALARAISKNTVESAELRAALSALVTDDPVVNTLLARLGLKSNLPPD